MLNTSQNHKVCITVQYSFFVFDIWGCFVAILTETLIYKFWFFKIIGPDEEEQYIHETIPILKDH